MVSASRVRSCGPWVKRATLHTLIVAAVFRDCTQCAGAARRSFWPSSLALGKRPLSNTPGDTAFGDTLLSLLGAGAHRQEWRGNAVTSCRGRIGGVASDNGSVSSDSSFLVTKREALSMKVLMAKAPQPPVIVLSGSDSERGWSQRVRENHELFAAARGYHYEYINMSNWRSAHNQKEPQWLKIRALLDVLRSAQEWQHILWVDDDVVFTSKDDFVDKMIADMQDKSLLIARDIRLDQINTGMMLLRNSEEAIEILEQTWQKSRGHLGYCKDQSCFHEQEALDRLISSGQVCAHVVNPVNELYDMNTMWRRSHYDERRIDKRSKGRNIYLDYDEGDPPSQRWRWGMNTAHISGMTPSCRQPMLEWLVEYSRRFIFGSDLGEAAYRDTIPYTARCREHLGLKARKHALVYKKASAFSCPSRRTLVRAADLGAMLRTNIFNADDDFEDYEDNFTPCGDNSTNMEESIDTAAERASAAGVEGKFATRRHSPTVGQRSSQVGLRSRLSGLAGWIDEGDGVQRQLHLMHADAGDSGTKSAHGFTELNMNGSLLGSSRLGATLAEIMGSLLPLSGDGLEHGSHMTSVTLQVNYTLSSASAPLLPGNGRAHEGTVNGRPDDLAVNFEGQLVIWREGDYEFLASLPEDDNASRESKRPFTDRRSFSSAANPDNGPHKMRIRSGKAALAVGTRNLSLEFSEPDCGTGFAFSYFWDEEVPSNRTAAPPAADASHLTTRWSPLLSSSMPCGLDGVLLDSLPAVETFSEVGAVFVMFKFWLWLRQGRGRSACSL